MEVILFNGKHFKDFIMGGFGNLKNNKGKVDSLNVFPVPDGDTGTNMFLTIQAAVKEIEQTAELSLSTVASALLKGSLMGARGNSGVILSQIFRGLAQSLGQHQEATAIQVAYALQKGVDTAYKAVMKPVEGTILTVAKECAREALLTAKNTDDVMLVLQAALSAGERALAFTPEQLPILKQAGVVDAGGKGFLVILEGGIKALLGDINFSSGEVAEEFVVAGEMITGKINFRYCTEFLVSGNEISVDRLQGELNELGDSLLVVGNEQLVKVHIHTNRPGLVLEKSIAFGELHEININNMADQYKDLSKNNGYDDSPEKISVVAVAAGSGLIKLLKSMGVEKVVTGGQTMNPSIEDLLVAVEQVSAEKVIILPNNSNIILAAKQAQELSEHKEVAVVPTKTFPQALAALLIYDNEAEFNKLVEEMTEQISTVKTGEITYAIRNSQYNGLEIKEGEIIGLVENEITCTGKNIDEVVGNILKNIITEENELITLFYGAGIDNEQVDNLVKKLANLYSNLEIETYNGGQNLYYYIIGVE